jgi:3-phenylpropionate/trans-cinnamate dioxygenase ferredoxin reductase subunit
MPGPFVIVGASLTGATAAATLRQEGFDGQIVLIGAEERLPYERPPLSKRYLRGEVPVEGMLVKPPAFYEENRIETVLGASAMRVATVERFIELDTGRRISYDKLLVATGGSNRRLPLPGLHLEGIHHLRDVDDADGIRSEIAAGRKAVVVGMGFIGSEVVASLRHKDVDVVVIHPERTPLLRVLGDVIGVVMARLHREHGADMIFEDAVVAFEGSRRVERVVTRAGRRIACDFVVVGVGIEPNVDVVAGTGIQVNNGIRVDEHCRTTVDGIYAAGDVANHYHPVFKRRMRVEHWQNAIRQGAAAARSMLDRARPYDEVHWFWTDQYDVNLQYAGAHDTWDRLVLRGSLDERDCLAFYMKDGVVDAVVALNRGRDLRRCIPLIKARRLVDPAMLQDENIDLRSLTDQSNSARTSPST